MTWWPMAGDRLSVKFLVMTNVPSLGPRALLEGTNNTKNLIICEGFGYLEPGGSGIWSISVPEGERAWRARVKWQRREMTSLDVLMNRLYWHDRVGCLGTSTRGFHQPIPP